MAAIDDDIVLMTDWTFLNHSPQAFFSDFISDALQSRHTSGSSTVKGKETSSQEEISPDCNSLYKVVDCGTGVHDIKRGGLAERMASRAGFSVPKLNIWHIDSASLNCSSPSVRSPFITIPPGLSPTVLLDSLAIPSNFLEFQVNANVAQRLTSDDDVPVPLEVTDRDEEKEGCNAHSQSLENVQSDFVKNSEWLARSNDSTFIRQTLNALANAKQLPKCDRNDLESQKVEFYSAQQAEDGYNWRKYGQKHVKGSEYPRSYYRCTYADCPVKKIVERSQQGNITDVAYKGVHNHPKPPINRRAPGLFASPCVSEQTDGSQHGLKANVEILPSSQNGISSLDEGPKPSSSLALAEESCDPLSAVLYSLGKSHDCMDITPTISNEEDDENQATYSYRNMSMIDDGEGDELESKRRKMDCSLMDSCTAPAREPRVVVQTISEVDILDDGYRWRKYGQKVVKGNPNPRSYYKCTSTGCNVRKHVERASHDLKSVITTYEGKHNHEVPIARSSNPGTAGTPGSSATSLVMQSPSQTELLELSQAGDMNVKLESHEGKTETDRSTVASALNISIPGHPQINVPGGLSSFRLGQFNLANFLMYKFNRPLNTYVGYSFENESEPAISSGASMMDVPTPNAELVCEHILSGLPLDLGIN